MTNLSFESAYALLKRIDQYVAADFDALGITPQDFQLVANDAPWRRDNLNRVMRTMNALLFGTLEVMGMPKIVIPSEYLAAIITAVVAPANRMVCCVWMAQERQTGIGALEQSARSQATSQLDPTSADALFALVVMLTDSNGSNEARIRMHKKLGVAIQRENEKVLTK